MMSAPGSGANCLLAEWLQVLGVELPVTGRGMPFIGVRQAQQSWLVRNSSVSYTRHCLPGCLLRDTVGVLGLPFAAAAAETSIPICHNSVPSGIADSLAYGSVCLLALDIGPPAQLSVTPVTKVGNSFWCVLQPVLDVQHKLICA